MKCSRKKCKNKIYNKLYSWIYKTSKINCIFCSEQCLAFKFPAWTNK